MSSQTGAEEVRYQIHADLQWRWCLGGVVALSPGAVEALHIGPPSALWFTQLQHPVTLNDLVDSMRISGEERSVDLASDAVELLGRLADLGVVTVVP